MISLVLLLAAATPPEVVVQAGGLSFDTIAFRPDGAMLATGGLDAMVRLWDLRSARLIRAVPVAAPVTALAFEADGLHLIAGTGGKGVVARIEVERGVATELGDLANPSRAKRTISFDYLPVERLAISGGEVTAFGAGASATWRVDGGALVSQDKQASKERPPPLSPDGKRSARIVPSGPTGHRLEVFEVATGKVRWASGDDLWPVAKVAPAFSPDGRMIAVAVTGGLALLDAGSGAVVRRYQGLAEIPLDVLVSRDGRSMVVRHDDGIDVWDLAHGTVRWSKRVKNGRAYAALDPEGRVVIATVGLQHYALDIRELESGKAIDGLVRVIVTDLGIHVRRMAISPSGSALAFTTSEGLVALFDLATRKPLARYAPRKKDLSRAEVAFSADGAKLAIARTGDAVIDLVDVAHPSEAPEAIALDPKMSGALRGFLPAGLAFTGDGKALIVAERGLSRVDLATGKWRYLAGNGSAATSFALAGDRAVLGHWDGSVELLDATTGRSTATLKGHGSVVEGVAFDGTRLLSASRDGTVRTWDLAAGTWRAAFASFEGGDAAAVIPSGHYSASRGALRGLSFRAGSRVFPFDQFDLRFNRPDLVLAALGMASPEEIEAYRTAHERRLRRVGIDETTLGDDFHVPELTVDRAKLPLTTAQRKLEIAVEARDGEVPLTALSMTVNDVPAAEVSFTRGEREARRKLPVELSLGPNRIAVWARNARGAESLREVIDVTLAPPGKPRKRDVYALAIGVSKYRDSRWDLSYAAKDARDVAEMVSFEMTGDQYGRIFTKVLTDAQVTREGIEAAKQHLARATVDDAAIVFVAGHGLLGERGDYWFATHDVDFAKPEARGVPYDGLERLFDRTRARRRLMLIDTCHAGEDETATATSSLSRNVKARGVKRLAGGGSVARASVVLSEVFADVRRASGAIVIASASASELAWESEKLGNGVFTHVLRSGFGPTVESDPDHDGRVRVSELRDYVFRHVRELTGGAQTPTARNDRVENDFALR